MHNFSAEYSPKKLKNINKLKPADDLQFLLR